MNVRRFGDVLKTPLPVALIALLLMLSPSTGAMARSRTDATAAGSAYAHELLIGGKPLEAPPYRAYLKQRSFQPAFLEAPPGEGLSRYGLQRDFSAGDSCRGAWRVAGTPAACYIDDGAVACRERLPAPSGQGIYRYRWVFSSPGGASATVEWEYRVLSPCYARLLSRVNGGAFRAHYGGDAVAWLDLTSGFLPVLLAESADDESLEKTVAGTWSITRDHEGLHEKAGAFDLRMLAVRELSLSPPERGLSSFSLSPVKVTAEVRALPEKSSLFPAGWCPDTVSWRFASFRRRNEGAFIVRGAQGRSIREGGAITITYEWDGKGFDSLWAEGGTYRLMLQARAVTGDGQVRSQLKGIHAVRPYEPALIVRNERGEIIADSREESRADAKPPAPQCAGDESADFEPAGGGIERDPSLSSGSTASRISMKSLRDGQKFLVTAQGFSPAAGEARLVITSMLPGREALVIPLGKGERRDVMVKATSDPAPGALLIGRKAGESRAFALMDLTYPEDSLALKGELLAQGWVSRGELFWDSAKMRDKTRFARDFLRACGFETLLFTCDGLPEVRAVLHVKNQADLFYYSGHGWGNGFIYIDGGYLHPAEEIEDGDWDDGLKMVIFSSCSVLDIQNYNRRSFTAMGKRAFSPGIAWAQAAGPHVALLGYNWSTHEGIPPGAFDTRVVRRFFKLLPLHGAPVAWIYANILEGDAVAPCAIHEDRYYFINASSQRIVVVPREYWNSARLPRGLPQVPWPR
ncbi:MAG: hypothetical protein RDV48_03015 [Candidatus Eremiobacteraeota bacterium]|nr:hypothetical protein [Candidatus Eremiobacteraeota bacterium]